MLDMRRLRKEKTILRFQEGIRTRSGIKNRRRRNAQGSRQQPDIRITQIRFEQPKNLAAKDFMKRRKAPKYDKDDQALVKQGFRITHTFEIKPRLDTVESKIKSNNYRNRKT